MCEWWTQVTHTHTHTHNYHETDWFHAREWPKLLICYVIKQTNPVKKKLGLNGLCCFEKL